jgi:hypothetical protein
MSDLNTQLVNQAWLGKWFRAEEGELSLIGGQLRFTTKRGCIVDTSIAAIGKLVWHSYSASAAFEATIAGKRYFLSFVPRSPTVAQLDDGMAVGRRWRVALSGGSEVERARWQALPLLTRVLLLLAYGLGGVFNLLMALGGHADWLNTALAALMGTGMSILAILTAIDLFRMIRALPRR